MLTIPKMVRKIKYNTR